MFSNSKEKIYIYWSHSVVNLILISTEVIVLSTWYLYLLLLRLMVLETIFNEWVNILHICIFHLICKREWCCVKWNCNTCMLHFCSLCQGCIIKKIGSFLRGHFSSLTFNKNFVFLTTFLAQLTQIVMYIVVITWHASVYGHKHLKKKHITTNTTEPIEPNFG